MSAPHRTRFKRDPNPSGYVLRLIWDTLALIQRCQVHKLRNVLDHLPEASRARGQEAIQKAYRAGTAPEAKNLLLALRRKLADEHPGAANSLDETLTVNALAYPSGSNARCRQRTPSST